VEGVALDGDFAGEGALFHGRLVSSWFLVPSF